MITLLAIYGVTYLVCDSKILERPRLLLCRVGFLRNMLACYFCTGFWVALGVYMYLGRSELPDGLDSIVLYSFAGASVAYMLDAAVAFLFVE